LLNSVAVATAKGALEGVIVKPVVLVLGVVTTAVVLLHLQSASLWR